MRIFLKVEFPVEIANAAAKNGTMAKTIQSILDEQKPEAAYFLDWHGKRAGFLFLHLEEPADIPKVAEPWFQAFNASIELHPAMAPEDLAKARPAIEAAVQKYG